jgi:urease accessory protein UreE
MLCDRVLYPLAKAPADGKAEEALPLQWWELNARAIRGRSESGEAVRVLLPLGVSLREGDVLHEDERRRLVVRVVPCKVYVLKLADPGAAAIVGAELGNLHLPLEVQGQELLTPCDGPAAGVFLRLGVQPQVQSRKFQPIRSLALAMPTVSPALRVRRAGE